MVSVELIDGEVVRHHRAVESPLTAEHVGQQPAIAGAHDAVDLLVRVHHRRQAALAHGHLERAEVDIAQLAFGQVRRRPVHPAFGRAVADEVLGGGDHPVDEVVALQAPDERQAHLRHEVRVFAVGLLEPAPARITADVEHRRQALVGTDRAHLAADRVGDRAVVLRPERRGDTDRLREHRGLARHQTRTDLLVDDGRDAEPGLEQEPLHLVGEQRCCRGAEARRPAHPGDVTDAGTDQRGRPLHVEAVVSGDLEHPDAAELSQFLVERHAVEEIRDSIVDRRGRVEVQGVGVGERHGRRWSVR